MLKYKKLWLMLLALICLIGVAVLIVIGIKRTAQSDLVEGLESLGLKTFEAYDAGPDEDGEEGSFIIYYRYVDPKYGEIIFSPSVDKNEYGSYLFDAEVAKTDPEHANRKTVDRYVYVFPLNGKTESIIEDHTYSLDEVSKLIDPTPNVSATYYYIFAGILLLAGAYLLFIALVPKRTPEQKSYK